MPRISKPVRPASKIVAQRSWSIETWPPEIWPNSPSRARYIVRVNRDSLLTHGALARVGRDLIIFGPKYQRWLEMHAANVPDYDIAPNMRRDSTAAPL